MSLVTPQIAKLVDSSLAALGFELDDSQRQQTWQFLELLLKWNKKFNLTAITDVREIIIKHFIDSWSLAPFIKDDQHILDVGTGGGFPGVPLSIIYPDKQFTLLDAVAKKITFLQHVKINCGLKNITTVHHRIESYLASTPFDVIMCRAFASIGDIIDKTQHCLAPEGRILMMKGVIPEHEIAMYGGEVVIETMSVPYLDAERHLIIVKGAHGDSSNSHHKPEGRSGQNHH